MEISFDNKKLEKVFRKHQALVKKYGPKGAQRIIQRYVALQSVANLDEMRSLPGRCHELTGDHKGQYALDLVHPYRLIFEPDHEPIPRKSDGGIDWTAGTAVTIIAVEDYHG